MRTGAKVNAVAPVVLAESSRHNNDTSKYDTLKRGMDSRIFEDTFKGFDFNMEILEKILILLDAELHDIKYVYDRSVSYNKDIENINICIDKAIGDLKKKYEQPGCELAYDYI